MAIYSYVPAYSLSLYFLQIPELSKHHNHFRLFLALFGRGILNLVVIMRSLRVINSWYKRVPLIILHQPALLTGFIYVYAYRENSEFMDCLRSSKSVIVGFWLVSTGVMIAMLKYNDTIENLSLDHLRRGIQLQ